MNILTPAQVRGDVVHMNRTDPRHLGKDGQIPVQGDVQGTGFGSLFKQSLQGANELVQESAQISQQMLYDPESVDSHDVTIAMAKANTAVSMTKAVVDAALKAYREIISIR